MRNRVFGVLALIMLFGLFLGSGRAETIYGGAAGNGNDNLENTFHFQSQNIDVRLAKPDGALLSQAEISSAYGSAYKIFSGGEDWVDQLGLQALGADLSAGNWTSSAYPPLGQVAVDPANGRFKFAAAGWEAAVRLNPAASDVKTLSVAINDQGQALCGRTENGASWHGQAMVNAYDPKLGWQGAIAVDSEATSKGTRADVALNNQGQGLCLYDDNLSATIRLWLNTYQVGAGWQGSVQVNTGAITSPRARGVVLNDAGACALFFWGNSNSRLYAKTLEPATGWSAAQQLDANNLELFGTVSAINSSGQIACAFSQTTAAHFSRVYVNLYQPGAGWSGPTQVDPGLSKDAGSPAVAINSSGMVACTFSQDIGAGHARQYVNLYLPGSGWQGPVIVDGITNTEEATVFPLSPSDIVLEDTGHVICAYNLISLPDTMSVQISEYRMGIGWMTPTLLASTVIPQWAYVPKLAKAGQGRILCGFTIIDLANTTSAVASREYLPASGWGPLQYFGPDNNTILYALAMNNQGLAVAGLIQGAMGMGDQLAYGDVHRVESPAGPVTVNYSYQSLTATAAPVTVKRVEVTGRELKPLQNRRATIAFDLDQAGWVSITIYSLRGDRVRTLANQYYASGRYGVEWGGENDTSQLVASGVYIIYIKTPGLEKKQKVVVVK
jgi:hypothetical protein